MCFKSGFLPFLFTHSHISHSIPSTLTFFRELSIQTHQIQPLVVAERAVPAIVADYKTAPHRESGQDEKRREQDVVAGEIDLRKFFSAIFFDRK